MDQTIEIYHLRLNDMYCRIAQMESFLNVQEIEKSKSFIFEKDRNQFLLCRGALRKILSKYLACHPKDIYFDYGIRGKPRLDNRYHEEPLQFNLSHTENYALIAVTLHRQIGIDIEYQRNIVNLDSLLSTSLSAKESQQIRSLPKEEGLFFFFQYWTHKEALLKAWGSGLQDELSHYEMGCSQDLSLPIFFHDKEGKLWTVENIIPLIEDGHAWCYWPTYVAAVAYEGTSVPITHLSPIFY